MRLGGLFKRRGCAVLVAVALFLCLTLGDVEAQDKAIFWDIQNAIWRDEGDKVVRLIRQNGIDINGRYYIHGVGSPGKDTDYATALSSATYQGCPNVVKALLDAGADVNAKDRTGSTALFAPPKDYSRDGITAAIRVLINAGAAQNGNGSKALMVYANWGRSDLLKILLDAGADVNKRNNEGATALMYAEESQNSSVATMLRRAGARGGGLISNLATQRFSDSSL